jgi:DNA-binding transcriptional ArsR family regulator
MLVDSKSAIFFNTVDKHYDNCFRSYCKLLSNYSYNLLPEQVAIIRDNLDYLTPCDCKVFNIVARKQSKYFKTFPSIKEIARAAGVSISTVKRALKKLVALGLIESIIHQFLTRTSKWWSNIYKIGAWIYHPDLTSTMAKYFFIFIGNLFPKSGYLQARLPEPNEPLLYIYKEDITSKKGYLTVKQEDSYIRESFTARWMSLLVETFLSHPSKKSKYQKFHAYETSYDDRPVFGSEFY